MKKAKGEGELLRAYLRDEKIHQGDLREKLGASRGAIESYVDGRNKPKVDIANRAANYFNLTTDQHRFNDCISGVNYCNSEMQKLLSIPATQLD